MNNTTTNIKDFNYYLDLIKDDNSYYLNLMQLRVERRVLDDDAIINYLYFLRDEVNKSIKLERAKRAKRV